MQAREQQLIDSNAPKIYGFWKYDLFPFLLGGSGYLVEQGRIWVAAYSGAFKTAFVLTNNEGTELRRELGDLTAEFYAEKDKLNQLFLSKRDQLLKKYGATVPK